MTTTSIPTTTTPNPGSPIHALPATAQPGTILRAVISKELRQNLIFLAFAFVIEAIVIFVAEWFRTGFFSESFDNGYINILLYPSIQSSVPLACATAALCLGIFQPLWDLNFERWSFIIHRPASRTTLFAGRLLAGLILYFFAAGLPILLLFLAATTHFGGHFFLHQYTYPYIADFATGIVYYFAGLLIADRQARIYGSRVVPLLLALGASVASFYLLSLPLALFSALVCTIILALACLGSHNSHGYTLYSPKLPRLATAFTLLLAFSLLLFPAAIALRAYHFDHRPVPAFTRDHYPATTTRHILRPDATLAISTITETFYADRSQVPPGDNPTEVPGGFVTYKATSYTDLQGHPLPPPDETQRDKNPAHQFTSPDSFTSPYPTLANYRDTQSLAGSHVQHLLHPEGSPDIANLWVFDHTRNIYFIYLVAPGAYPLIGTLGANGLVPPPGRAEPFDHPSLHDRFVLTPHTLYHLDFAARAIIPVFTTSPGEQLLQFNSTWEADKLGGYWLMTSKRLVILSEDWDSRALLEFPLTHDFHGLRLQVTHFPQQNRWAFEYRSSSFNFPDYAAAPENWEFYDEHATLMTSYNFPHLIEFDPPLRETFSPEALATRRSFDAQDGALTALANPLFLASINAARRALSPPPDPRYGEPDIQQVFLPIPTAPSLLTFSATLLVCAALALLVATFYRLPRRLLWTLLALVTGPAALLTLIAMHTLPARAKCSICRKRRPLANPLCPHCQAPWPDPPTTGTEIFATHSTT